ncbi:MAG TPA: DUF1330 domain-containing protein [Azospirillaceae bacterium]|nr:DUF1330 domain-containing protein [Azospirillaceae bacterium]
MTVYALGQITITEPEAYGRYQAAFMPVLIQYGGRLLAADTVPEIIEGEWPHQKLVLLSFPDEAAFRRWEQSPEYQEIARDRRAGATGVVMMVRGI